MLGETRLAAMLAKAVAQDPTAAPVFAMLEAATLGGARALRWDADIGSLEIGKAADLFAIDLGTPESLPVADPAAQILYSAGRECITHTWVDGRLIMENTLAPPIRRPMHSLRQHSVPKSGKAASRTNFENDRDLQ